MRSVRASSSSLEISSRATPIPATRCSGTKWSAAPARPMGVVIRNKRTAILIQLFTSVSGFVLLSVIFFARRDEFPSRGLGHSWGRLLTCGGLAIRLPLLDPPAEAAENRQHGLRLAAMRGRLAIRHISIRAQLPKPPRQPFPTGPREVLKSRGR